MLCDLHIHSDNSFDAESTVEQICESALNMGLDIIAITDHCEAEFINMGENCEFGSFDRQIPKSISDTAKAIEKYSGRLKILHNLRGRDDFYYMDFDKVDINTVLDEYFDELIETAAFEHFDSLAHLTYPLRYIFERKNYFPDLRIFQGKIDKIFSILISNNKALEINVSGLFKPMGVTLPDLPLVKRFFELGGRYITVGSDAHTADMVGKGIKEGLDVAKQAGFNQFTIFENHKPVLFEI